MCETCRNKIKEEIEFLLRILCTPGLYSKNIEIVNDVLQGALVDLYSDDEEDELAEDSDVNTSGQSYGTYTYPDSGITITYTLPSEIIDDLSQILK